MSNIIKGIKKFAYAKSVGAYQNTSDLRWIPSSDTRSSDGLPYRGDVVGAD